MVESPGFDDASRLKIAQLLISRGAKVKDVEGALTTAVRFGRTTTFMQLLLDHGADPNQSGYHDGTTPLIAAGENGSLEQVKFLLRAGARLDARRNNGQTALDVAIKNDRTKIIAVLKEAAAHTVAPTTEK